MSLEYIAKVAISSANFAVDKPYDYRIPENLVNSAAEGVRVIMPFSRGNRRTEGVILAISSTGDTKGLKSIDKVLDEAPLLSREQINLALWMRERFFCTVYTAIKSMLPAGLWFKTEYSYKAAENMSREEALRALAEIPLAGELIELLYGSGKEIKYAELREAAGEEIDEILKKAVKAGAIRELVRDSRKIQDKTLNYAYLAIPTEDALIIAGQKRKKSPLQSAALEFLAAAERASAKDIEYYTGTPSSALKSMERAGLIRLEQEEVFRRPEPVKSGGMAVGELSDEQQRAFEGLRELLTDEPSAALLYGVTGSGKTVIYISLIREVMARGKTALVLVPEIALTPQLMSTFEQCFGDGVAVLHSSLGIGVQYDEWKRIKTGEVSVVVGTRSAIFAPLKNIGLIVIDEEQEYTYKSENSPRYNARDVAKYRCVQSGALLLLGSATPSIETMYSAKSEKYKLFTLDSRFNGRALPDVIIADMKKELRQGNGSPISSVLRAEIEENLKNGEQTILFINRRGASNFITCPECGYIYGCPNCSVSLTYHSVNKRVLCHYCGHSEPVGDTCPDCGGKLKHMGIGTQKVEEELHEMFPGVEVMRMDTDTVSAANPHDKSALSLRIRFCTAAITGRRSVPFRSLLR